MMERRILVLTADRAERGLLEPVMKELQMRDDVEAKWGEFWNSYSEASTNIKDFDELLYSFHPDIVMIPTDRSEMVYIAAHAFHRNFVLAHFHAGNNPAHHPDDINRKVISSFSHIMFANMDQHKRNLIYQGEEAWRIHVVGSTAFDHIDYDSSVTPKKPFAVIILHPIPTSKEETIIDLESIKRILGLVGGCGGALDGCRACLTIPVEQFIWIYPNNDNNNDLIKNELAALSHSKITTYKNLPKGQYMDLLSKCAVAIGNSSSFYYELPVVNPKAEFIPIGERNKGLVVPPTTVGGSKRIAEILATIPLTEKLRKKW